jgi:hypothetical protein
MEKQIPKKPIQNDISFKPITDGLGFHPFSDGLPYAPIAKAPKPTGGLTQSVSATGSGAVAAGPAKMVFPKASPQAGNSSLRSSVSVPVAKNAVISREEAGVGIRPVAIPAKQAAAEVKRSADSLSVEEYGLSYLLRRSLACVMDTFLLTSVFGIGLNVWLYTHPDASPDDYMTKRMWIIGILCLSLFNWLMTALQEVFMGSTLGKRMFYLKLGGSKTARLKRAILFVPCSLVFGLGILWAVIDSKRCCWHDSLSGIQPTEGS